MEEENGGTEDKVTIAIICSNDSEAPKEFPAVSNVDPVAAVATTVRLS